MDSLYGNEWKERFLNRFSSGVSAQLVELVNHPPVMVCNMSAWRCQRGWRVPERRVSDNMILMIQSGSVQVQYRGRQWLLKAGEVVLIAAGEIHSYTLAPGCEQCRNFVMHLLGYHRASGELFSGFASPVRRLHHPQAFFERMEMGVALRNNSPAAAAALGAELYRQIELEAAADGEYSSLNVVQRDARVAAGVEFIQRNYHRNISVPDMALAAGVSEVQFRRLFLRDTGMSPIVFLRQERLLQAARLLVDTDDTLAEISNKAGFHSTSYLCTSFRQFFQITPEEYRRHHR